MSITAQFLHIEPLNVKMCEQLVRHNNRSMHGIIFKEWTITNQNIRFSFWMECTSLTRQLLHKVLDYSLFYGVEVVRPASYVVFILSVSFTEETSLQQCLVGPVTSFTSKRETNSWQLSQKHLPEMDHRLNHLSNS